MKIYKISVTFVFICISSTAWSMPRDFLDDELDGNDYLSKWIAIEYELRKGDYQTVDLLDLIFVPDTSVTYKSENGVSLRAMIRWSGGKVNRRRILWEISIANNLEITIKESVIVFKEKTDKEKD